MLLSFHIPILYHYCRVGGPPMLYYIVQGFLGDNIFIFCGFYVRGSITKNAWFRVLGIYGSAFAQKVTPSNMYVECPAKLRDRLYRALKKAHNFDKNGLVLKIVHAPNQHIPWELEWYSKVI